MLMSGFLWLRTETRCTSWFDGEPKSLAETSVKAWRAWASEGPSKGLRSINRYIDLLKIELFLNH
jgi:hypothetical protein